MRKNKFNFKAHNIFDSPEMMAKAFPNKFKNEQIENSVLPAVIPSPSSFEGKKQLIKEHQSVLLRTSHLESIKISIEYAIKVLEEMKKETEMGFLFKDQARILKYFGNRIDELKMLLK